MNTGISPHQCFEGAGGVRTGRSPFCSESFWRIASEVGCKAIIGLDAHDPSHMCMLEYQDHGFDFLDEMGIKIVELLNGLE